MDMLEFLADIVIYGSSDFVGNKKISHTTRKRILIIFIIVSLCYLGFSVFGIFWAIKTKSLILLTLIILVFVLFLYNLYKTIEKYNDAQLMNKEIIKDFFDNLAPNWDNEPIADTTIINTILDNAKVCESIDILDVGCGTGVMFPFYLERNVNSITAVDLSTEMVKIAKAKFPQAEIICGDAENITFDRQFDVIMIYNAFPHFSEPQKLIENLAKHLNDGGRLCIAHGMSKKELDDIHIKSAGKVSNILPECNDLAEMLKPHFNVDIMISNDKMYQVSGMKR